MDKYDNEEKHKEFLNSPEYKAQQKAKVDAKIAEE